jgi:hypothetical protein
MTGRTWTLEEIRQELEKQRVTPLGTFRLHEHQAERLKAGRWRVVTIGSSGAEIWEVDNAELMWLTLRCIEASEFVVSVAPLDPAERVEVEHVGHGRR